MPAPIESHVKEVVREKYGQAAKRVAEARNATEGCCGCGSGGDQGSSHPVP